MILEDVNHFFPSQLQEEVTELKGQSEESQIAEVNSHFLHICYISNNYRNILNIFNILNIWNGLIVIINIDNDECTIYILDKNLGATLQPVVLHTILNVVWAWCMLHHFLFPSPFLSILLLKYYLWYFLFVSWANFAVFPFF